MIHFLPFLYSLCFQSVNWSLVKISLKMTSKVEMHCWGCRKVDEYKQDGVTRHRLNQLQVFQFWSFVNFPWCIFGHFQVVRGGSQWDYLAQICHQDLLTLVKKNWALSITIERFPLSHLFNFFYMQFATRHQRPSLTAVTTPLEN